VRPFALVTALATLAGCGSDEPAQRPDVPAATDPRPACVPRGNGRPRICGLAPPQRPAPGGIAYKATTVTGRSFWVTVPDELATLSGVVAVPTAPLRVNGSLTTAAPRDAADRFCDGFRDCEPTAVSRAPGPVVRWDDASGSIRDLGVTTLDLGAWTLVLAEPDADRVEAIARAVTSRVGRDGYPRLRSVEDEVPLDADWAGVLLWVGEYLIHVMPGCELSAKKPEDLGGSAAGPELALHEQDGPEAGTWCAGGRFWVDVTFAERPTLELLHEKLRIVPA
jgi:hypothetical protein